MATGKGRTMDIISVFSLVYDNFNYYISKPIDARKLPVIVKENLEKG